MRRHIIGFAVEATPIERTEYLRDPSGHPWDTLSIMTPNFRNAALFDTRKNAMSGLVDALDEARDDHPLPGIYRRPMVLPVRLMDPPPVLEICDAPPTDGTPFWLRMEIHGKESPQAGVLISPPPAVPPTPKDGWCYSYHGARDGTEFTDLDEAFEALSRAVRVWQPETAAQRVANLQFVHVRPSDKDPMIALVEED